jgi:hypothetical protein
MANQGKKGQTATSRVPPRAAKGKAPARGATNRGTAAQPRPPRNRPPRRGARVNYRRAFYIGGAIFAAIAIVVVVVVLATSGSSGGGSKSAVNYTLANGTKVYGGIGPEGIPLQLGPQLASPNAGLTGAPIDGIQCNTSEQLVYHHHAHLAIFVNGKPYSVPLGVGMVPPAQVQKSASGDFATGSNTCLYWIHVHAQDGIVHLESPQPGNFQLGQVFGIWFPKENQPLTASQVGPSSGQVTATVNGQAWTGDPAQIPLTEHAQIVLNVGGPIITPPPISWSGTQL